VEGVQSRHVSAALVHQHRSVRHARQRRSRRRAQRAMLVLDPERTIPLTLSKLL
jgi:hypothetical protein